MLGDTFVLKGTFDLESLKYGPELSLAASGCWKHVIVGAFNFVTSSH